MSKKRYSEGLWAEAKRRCRLDTETLDMAIRDGFEPKEPYKEYSR